MKKRLLFIFPGPKQDFEATFGEKLYEYSKVFSGYVLTTSYSDYDGQIGEFRVIANGETNFRGMAPAKRLKNRAEQLFDESILEGKPIELVITYDPLTTGLIGVALTKRFDAKLIVELNGNYHLPQTYVDTDNWFRRKYLQVRNLITMCFVIGSSDGVKLLYEKQLNGIPKRWLPRNVAWYPEYVDLVDFEKLRPGGKTILFVGFPFKLKGVDLLISAFQRLSCEYSDWTLRIVGWYPDKSVIASWIGAHPSIELCDPVPRSKVARYMSESSILVLPSRSEAMGRVLLEAAAVGLARIGSTAGGIPEVIDDGVDGLLFKEGDVEDLYQKLEMLVSDPGLRSVLGEQAKRSLREDLFSKEKFYSKSISFYQQIIETD